MGYRPYICLSNRLISAYANIAIFAPISNTKRQYPLYIPLEDTASTGAVMLDQLVTIDYNVRSFRYIETVSDVLLKQLLDTVVLVFQNNKAAGKRGTGGDQKPGQLPLSPPAQR
jgi:mRNA interferase MazF